MLKLFWLMPDVFPLALTIRVLAEVETDPFKILRDGYGFATDETVRGAGQSFYQLMMVLGVIGILSSILIGGLILAINSKNGNNRQEAKHSLFVKCGIAVLIFGFTGILGMVLEIIGQI